MLDVVAVDAPAMLADFGDYGEVPSLAPESVASYEPPTSWCCIT